MKYSLYLATAGDDKHTVYSYVITNYEGIKDSGTFIAVGERRHDESYCGHIALQRALRKAAKMEGVIHLHLNFDETLTTLAFEIIGIDPPLYPALERTTQRVLRRFQHHEVGYGDYGTVDADKYEATTLDVAIEELEHLRTIKGNWQLFIDRFINPNKIIR